MQKRRIISIPYGRIVPGFIPRILFDSFYEGINYANPYQDFI